MVNQSAFKLDKKNEFLSTEKELQFILSQAEKALVESAGSGESVLARSTILSSVLLAILTSEIGMIISFLITVPTINKLYATILIVLVFTLFSIYKLVPNLFGA